jgi:hypothetical protein
MMMCPFSLAGSSQSDDQVKADLMVRIDEALGHGTDTRLVNQYVERFYNAVMHYPDSYLVALQRELCEQPYEFRGAVWSGLSRGIKMKLQDLCPELT